MEYANQVDNKYMTIDQIILKLNNSVIQKRQVVIIENFSQKSKKIFEFLNILENYNFIEFWSLKENSQLIIKLKYDSKGFSTFKKINLISKKNVPIFFNTQNLWQNSINNFLILSTSKGLLTKEEARLLNIGGLAFCNII